MSKLREGQLVWIDDPGFPNDEWNGISCTIENLNVNGYVQVRPVIPFKNKQKHPETNLFTADEVKPETRPWLKKHLGEFLKMRTGLLSAAEKITEQYG